MRGDRDKVNALNADGTRPTSAKRSDDLSGWATDIGVRLRLDPQCKSARPIRAPVPSTSRTAAKQPFELGPAPSPVCIASVKPFAARCNNMQS